MANRDEIKSKVMDVVADHLNKPKDDLKEDMHIVNDLGADSLDAVEIMMDIEDAFDLSIPEEDAEKIQTIKDAVDYVENAADAA